MRVDVKLDLFEITQIEEGRLPHLSAASKTAFIPKTWKVNGAKDSMAREMIKQFCRKRKITRSQDAFKSVSWSWKMLPVRGRF